METKYIFVTGGVVSSLGKGLTAASLGRLLKDRGLKVRLQKFDPYINVDPGKMSPLQHGEVFVTNDGAETDLDIGHYERFTDINLDRNCDVTTGIIYKTVLENDEKGIYDGRTIQVIPHITNEIKSRISKVTENHDVDVVITEIGGTVGDIEGLPFLEAIRQAKYDFGKDNVLYIHVTLIPYLSKSQELKTKPTQHSVKELRSIGIQPDIIILRTEHSIDQETIDKIALFCDMEPGDVFENKDCDSIYELPMILEEANLSKKVIEKLKIEDTGIDNSEWIDLLDKIKKQTGKVKIGLIAKYVDLKDAYLSIYEALNHAGILLGQEVEIEVFDAEEIQKDTVNEQLRDCQGLLIPAGFGDRGLEGMILSSKYARENKIPILGISMGMHAMTIDICRNILEIDVIRDNKITENPRNDDVIYKSNHVPENGRVGSYPIKLSEDSKIRDIYKKETIYERHRNEYEVNPQYEERLQKVGLNISGKTVDDQFIEVVELENHPFFIGVQYEAQFNSTPIHPHKLFIEFLKFAMEI